VARRPASFPWRRSDRSRGLSSTPPPKGVSLAAFRRQPRFSCTNGLKGGPALPLDRLVLRPPLMGAPRAVKRVRPVRDSPRMTQTGNSAN
jgi:hypothetical protein